MNFMGMGMPEMGVVLLVAFLVLGPSRAISMARTAGKIVRDLQRTFKDVASAINLDQPEQPTVRRGSSPSPDRVEGPPSRDTSPSPDRVEGPPSLDPSPSPDRKEAPPSQDTSPSPDREEAPPSKAEHE